ncbi:LysE family transporter [Siccirubricoccus sp. G192]|uniref:LysE family transporter n=1 Tax=Siccirubricoccus sp. G192 TaxID=2849651 RepID=UPI001C2BF569|nr:LysE family transporter [Siccirubricoccus sp. G192]MBV1800077.1 LysE family transporter [Siccirubricoccus sp. G192]
MPPDMVLGPTTALAGFALGYLALMAAPGANMLAIGSVASLRGFLGVLPLCAGVAAGASALAVALALASDLLGQDLGWEHAGRKIGALLLLMVAFRVAVAPRPVDCHDPNAPAPSARDRTFVFVTGFFVAVSNPATAAFFIAQFLGPVGAAKTLPLVLALVPLLALLGCAVIAALFARPAARRLMQLHYRLARMVSAAVLVAMALGMLRPVLSG